MEALIRKALIQAATLEKQPDAVPWKSDEPWLQPCYLWSTTAKAWKQLKLPASRDTAQSNSTNIERLALYTWNIDFMLPFAEERMSAALAHLEKLTQHHLSTTTAVVINIQECVPSDLATIGQKEWIRENFYVTDADTSAWASGAYGTTTLVDRRLALSSCFRVHYSQTKMERDALFVDVAIPTSSGSAKSLRLCNTHLESLVSVPPLRPSQMQLIAKYLHVDGLSGAIVAGDFNAIQPEDDSLHTDNQLKDAYLELGGKPNEEQGHTWGQQALRALREQFGLSRLDKVFFCGEFIRLLELERIGKDVVVEEREAKDELLSLGFEKAWVTDHLGLNAVFSFTGGNKL